jgi:hypothetical protein
MSGAIAAAPITQQQNGGSVGVVMPPMVSPPMANGVTSKFTGVMSGVNLDIAAIAAEVIQPMGNGDSCSQGFPIMVEDRNRFIVSIDTTFAIELSNQCYFFVSILNTGLPAAS